MIRHVFSHQIKQRRNKIRMTNAATNTLLGRVCIAGEPDSHDLVSIDVDSGDDGFAAAMVMDRAQGSARQEVLFASLPTGSSLFAQHVMDITI